MSDCKNCIHGTTLFIQERDRTTKVIQHIPYGRIACKKPGYGKRTYLVKEKSKCDAFKKRERNTESKGE